ncbi:hypothetical protein R0K17_27530, partial [Planococcus sp. SIMBA_143]
RDGEVQCLLYIAQGKLVYIPHEFINETFLGIDFEEHFRMDAPALPLFVLDHSFFVPKVQ